MDNSETGPFVFIPIQLNWVGDGWVGEGRPGRVGRGRGGLFNGCIPEYLLISLY